MAGATARQPRRFGAYDVVRKVAAGGMGTVYEARHRVLGRRAAVKVLHDHLAQNARAISRFVAEGQAASRIRHPAVVEIVDVGDEDGIPFLVMDYLEGEDLAARLAREGRMRPSEAIRTLLPVLAGLAAAHEANVIHRDLKPANVIVSPSGPVLVDFGISRVIGEELGLTGTDARIGTAYYMAPEQAASPRKADGRSDLYAFGVMLYECLTGERPYVGESAALVLRCAEEGKARRPSEIASDVPPALDAIVLRAIAPTPSARYQTASELRVALAAAMDGTPISSEMSVVRSAPEVSRSRPWVAPAGLLIGTVALGIVFTQSSALSSTTPSASARVPASAGASVEPEASASAVTAPAVAEPSAPSTSASASMVTTRAPSPVSPVRRPQTVAASASSMPKAPPAPVHSTNRDGVDDVAPILP